MKTKVLLFAHLREMAGTDQLSIDFKAGSKGADVLDRLQERFPGMKDHRRYLKLSMNGEYITADTELVDQAEIAVFPPVSGG